MQNTGFRGTGFSGCGPWALEHGLRICDTWASVISDMWNLPGSGIEPVSPAAAGGFSPTAPQGSSKC